MSIHDEEYWRAAGGRSWCETKIGELPVIAARARLFKVFQRMIKAEPETRLAERLHLDFGKAALEYINAYKLWRGLAKNGRPSPRVVRQPKRIR